MQRWKTLRSEYAYSGQVRIRLDSISTNEGELSTYEVDVSLPFAVAVLVLVNGSAVLSYQYRYPIDQWIYDLPGGGGDAGESPEEAARRELREELGIEVGELSMLQKFYPNPGRAAWPVFLFCAVPTLESEATGKDQWEAVAMRKTPYRELDKMIAEGEVVDPSLLVAWQSARMKGLLD